MAMLVLQRFGIPGSSLVEVWMKGCKMSFGLQADPKIGLESPTKNQHICIYIYFRWVPSSFLERIQCNQQPERSSSLSLINGL